MAELAKGFRTDYFARQRWMMLAFGVGFIILGTLELSHRDWFNGVLSLVLAVEMAWWFYRAPKLEVRIDPSGLIVRNMNRTVRIPWVEVQKFGIVGKMIVSGAVWRRSGKRLRIHALSNQGARSPAPDLVAALQELEAARVRFTAGTASG